MKVAIIQPSAPSQKPIKTEFQKAKEKFIKRFGSTSELVAAKNEDQFVEALDKQNNSNNAQKTVALKLLNVADGSYLLQCYNTWTGELSESMQVKIRKSKVILKSIHIPSNHDKAIWLRPAAQLSL